MRALRVVGVTESGDVVLEDPARHERYSVPADERLRAAARGDLTRLGQIAIELESQLRPREIQARIRAGASVEQVAAAAGQPVQKVERFAYPVLLERSRTAELARLAHPVRAEGPDERTLGEIVAHTFALRGQDYEQAEWDSWKGEDGRWVVALSWRAGRSDNEARWTFQPGAHGGTVTAVDEHAGDLVEGLPARPLRTVGPVIDMTRPEEQATDPGPAEPLRAAASDSVRPDAGRTDAARAEGPRLDAGRGRAGGSPPGTVPPAVPPPAAGPATGSRRPDAEVRQQPPADEPPSGARRPPTDARRGPAAGQPADEERSARADDDPGMPAEPRPEPAPVPKRTRKGKPVMPSWDEVLLGVRGPR